MKRIGIVAALLLAFAPVGAMATDGYFSHGYGMRAKGMGGAATAMTSDAFGGANNPATMVWVGERLDLGLDWFSPRRQASRSGSSGIGTGLDAAVTSDSNNFWVPEFAYNKMLNPDMSLGVSVYGNGGMNTDYSGGQIGTATASTACAGFNTGGAPAAPFNLLCGTGRLGVDLMQLIIAPTLAMKLNPNHSFGISPLLAYQRFKAEGLDGFAGFTPNPAVNNLTNRGYDSSHGVGLRLGWMGKLSDTVNVGAVYSPKMKMSKFGKYRDLFPAQGLFDLPENYNFGIAVKSAPTVTVAFDYQHISYGGVKSIANPSTYAGVAGSLGCDSCRGFGWSSVNVLKLGVEYQYNSAWTWRAGYNHTDNPIQARDVTFNIIAPGVVQDHVTLGFTYGLSKDSDLTLAYMHAFKNSVTGASLFNGFGVPAGNETIRMYQNSLGVAWSTKF